MKTKKRKGGFSKMAKDTSPTFIIDAELKKNQVLTKHIEQQIEIARVIYNTALGVLVKRRKQMIRTKEYQRIARQNRAVSEKLSLYKTKKDKKKIKQYEKEKARLMDCFEELNKSFQLSEGDVEQLIKPVRAHFNNTFNSAFAQKIAKRAWDTFYKLLTGKAKKVRFVPKGEMMSFEGKSNKTGWTFDNGHIVFQQKEFALKIDKKDLYLQEALSNVNKAVPFTYATKKGELKEDKYRVKFVRIAKRFIRGKYRYYAQLVCAGYPPPKRDRNTGEFKYPLGSGRGGVDIGTSSVAIATKTKVKLTNLGENIKVIDDVQRKIGNIQRQMDRSKRATNPDYFNENGTIKKGKKEWVFSKRYLKLKNKLKELHRKLALYRKLSHRQEANQLLMSADEFYVENMNFRALQKRAKETKISEKTGKYTRKKRFGKSIAHRAPSMFISILEKKVKNTNGHFIKVKTHTFKASQYDHMSNDYKKKTLKDRWHQFNDGTKIQRDCYSAFLLMCSNSTGSKTDRKLCVSSFDAFCTLHEQEINRLSQLKTIVLNSGIRLKNNVK